VRSFWVSRSITTARARRNAAQPCVARFFFELELVERLALDFELDACDDFALTFFLLLDFFALDFDPVDFDPVDFRDFDAVAFDFVCDRVERFAVWRFRATCFGLFHPSARSARNDRGMSRTPLRESVTASAAASDRSARTSAITFAGRRARAA
jgi:hypothetical protein